MRHLLIFVSIVIIGWSFFTTSSYAQVPQNQPIATHSGQVLGLWDIFNWIGTIFNLFPVTKAPEVSSRISNSNLPFNAVEMIAQYSSTSPLVQSSGSSVLAGDNEVDLDKTVQNASYMNAGNLPNESKTIEKPQTFFNFLQWIGVEKKVDKGNDQLYKTLEARLPPGTADQFLSPTLLGTGFESHACIGAPNGFQNCINGTIHEVKSIINDSLVPTVKPPALSCCALGTGFCSPEVLKTVFANNANNASQICQAESGGDTTKIVDGCTSGSGPYSYKVGLFQIDIMHSCPGAFAIDSSGNVKTPCIIADRLKLAACIQALKNAEGNIAKAAELSDNGATWSRWPSAYQCSLGGTPPSNGPTPAPGSYVQYVQTDPAWGSTTYPQQCTNGHAETLTEAGCGPTTLSMILATYGDINRKKTGYTPPETLQKYYLDEDLQCDGTTLSKIRSVLEQQGFETVSIFDIRPNTTPISAVASEFKKYIQSGWKIVGNANYDVSGTPVGHFFWIVDVDGANNVWIMDPWKCAKRTCPMNQNADISPQPKYKAAFAFRKK